MVVAGHGQHAAAGTGSGEIGVVEHIARTVDARRLAVPHAEDAVVQRPRRQVGVLRAPHRRRAEVAQRIVAAGIARDVASLDSYVWGARSPDGKVNPASLDDIQAWYKAQGVLSAVQPMTKVIDTSFAEQAAQRLGPYRPTNPDSKLAGCR